MRTRKELGWRVCCWSQENSEKQVSWWRDSERKTAREADNFQGCSALVAARTFCSTKELRVSKNDGWWETRKEMMSLQRVRIWEAARSCSDSARACSVFLICRKHPMRNARADANFSVYMSTLETKLDRFCVLVCARQWEREKEKDRAHRNWLAGFDSRSHTNTHTHLRFFLSLPHFSRL